MSATAAIRPAERRAADLAPTSHRAVPTRSSLLPGLIGIFSFALALRIYNIRTSNNIFIDEILYSQVGTNVADGRGVSLFGQAFNLHPPAPFAILGGVVKLFGLSAGNPNPDTLLLQLRPVAAVFGALTVTAVYLVMRRCGAGALIAVTTTAVVALDPFQISFDSRVMLEAFAQFFAICAIGLLVAMRPPHATKPHRMYRALVIAAGVAAGLVMGTKETFGLVVAGVLLLLLVCPRLVSRRATLTMIGAGVVTYLLVVSVAWFSAGFGPWLTDKTSGLRRLIGTEQTTGFNAGTTSVTLADRLLANVAELGATYLILIAGGIVTIVDLVRRKPWHVDEADGFGRARSLISLWNLCACGYLVYATLFGSIEEQMYYIPLVPCVLSLGLAAVALRRRARPRPRRRARPSRGRGVVMAVLVAVVLAFQSTVWVQVHTTDQNRFETFLTWQRSHVLDGSRIGVTDEPSSFLIRKAVVGQWPTIAQLRANKADYVLVDSSLVQQGYSTMAPPALRYLRAHAPVAFSTTVGGATLYLFDLRGPY